MWLPRSSRSHGAALNECRNRQRIGSGSLVLLAVAWLITSEAVFVNFDSTRVSGTKKV
jgi:hypothetical protein